MDCRGWLSFTFYTSYWLKYPFYKCLFLSSWLWNALWSLTPSHMWSGDGRGRTRAQEVWSHLETVLKNTHKRFKDRRGTSLYIVPTPRFCKQCSLPRPDLARRRQRSTGLHHHRNSPLHVQVQGNSLRNLGNVHQGCLIFGLQYKVWDLLKDITLHNSSFS